MAAAAQTHRNKRNIDLTAALGKTALTGDLPGTFADEGLFRAAAAAREIERVGNPILAGMVFGAL